MYRNLKNINSGFVRDVNTNLVLNTIRQQKMISRSDLARITKLSYPTVAKIIKDLTNEGFVSEAQIGEFLGGRKPMLSKFNPDSRYVIGLDLSGKNVQAVLADLDGNFISEIVVGSDLSAETDLTQVTMEVINELTVQTGLCHEKLIGIGASLRGSFDLPNKLFYYAESGAVPVRLLEGLEENYQVPIVMDHISNIALRAEKLYGVAGDAVNASYINVDSGVSAGLMINTQIYQGSLGNAGEFGHISIEDNEEICPDCGRRGCLENMASVYAILEAARRENLALPVGDYIYQQLKSVGEQAQAGNPKAKKCFEKAIWGLGEGIVDLINLLNLELVILGGRVIMAYPAMVEEIRNIVLQQCWPFSKQNLKVVSASLSKNLLLQGAISLVLDEVFFPYGIDVNKTMFIPKT